MRNQLISFLIGLGLVLGHAPELLAQAKPHTWKKATFAGGCFWCMEPPFEKLPGVKSVISGYTDGHLRSPTYKQVTSGKSGHTEAVEITFDPKVVSYQKLLEVFWANIDPTVKNRQFCDVGSQYRTGIYFHDKNQEDLAKISKTALLKKWKTIYTEIKASSNFYRAEEYHQDYYKKNPLRYKYYRLRCGRDERLHELWSKPRGK